MDDQTNDKGRAIIDSTKEEQQGEAAQETGGDLSGSEKAVNLEQLIEMVREKDPERSAKVEPVAREILNHFTAKDPDIITLFLLVVKKAIGNREPVELLNEILNEIFEDSGKAADNEGDLETRINDHALKINRILQTSLIEHAKIGGKEIPALASAVRLVLDYSVPRIFENILKQIAEQQTTLTQAPQATVKAIQDGIKYPLDKPNSLIWNLLESSDPNGQINLEIDTSKNGSKQDSIVLYSINFEELQDAKITKQLTPFDKRVYIACGSLQSVGNDITSTEQIHYAMGNTTTPSTEQKKKIDESLTKMNFAHLYINNSQEVNQTSGNSLFVYDASLLPFERTTAYINGKYTESAIHFFREPPLISFAKERKQITAVPKQLLTSPISKTVSNLQLEDYLIWRIARMKNGAEQNRKINYAKIYDKCGIKDKKQRQRTPEKIRRYFEHYKKTGWIKDFKETEEKDGILIVID